MKNKRSGAKVIASRTLLLDCVKKISIRIKQPVKSRDYYSCDFQIRGLSGVKGGTASGEDSLQSLLIAIQAVRLRLKAYRGQLSFENAPCANDDGLPSAMIFRDELTERLCDIVEVAEKRNEARVVNFVADGMAKRLSPDAVHELNTIEAEVGEGYKI